MEFEEIRERIVQRAKELGAKPQLISKVRKEALGTAMDKCELGSTNRCIV